MRIGFDLQPVTPVLTMDAEVRNADPALYLSITGGFFKADGEWVPTSSFIGLNRSDLETFIVAADTILRSME